MGISSALGSSALLPAGLGFRNLIINGDMRIDQRGSASSAVNNIAGGDAYFLDRWHTYGAVANKIAATQVTTASLSGTAPSDPVVYTSKLTSAASTFTPGVGDPYGIRQYVEGTNIGGLGWGTSNARQLVLSFWVRSSVTGTYAIAIFNSAVNRSFVQTYTVNVANTWEKKTVYITGDSSGTWLTTTGIGLHVWWDLGSGSNFNTTAGTWQAALKVNTSAQTNWVGQNAATFYLTGVQLEQNYQPTPFEQRPYGVELALCQRYFWSPLESDNNGYTHYGQGFAYSTTQAFVQFNNPVQMRVPITSARVSYSTLRVSDTVGAWAVTAISVSDFTKNRNSIQADVTIGTASFTSFRPCLLQSNNSASAYIRFDAEL